MTVRDRLKDPAVLLRLGCAFLILASLARWFFHPTARISDDVVDGSTGLLYGLAIGTLLLSVRRRCRSTSR